jgi:hypothetical protein
MTKGLVHGSILMSHHVSYKCNSEGNKLRGYLIYWSVRLNLQYTSLYLVCVSFAVRSVDKKNKNKREQNKRIIFLRINSWM